MTKLISDSDFADIRVVLNDVGETFLQLDISYKRHAATTGDAFGWGQGTGNLDTNITIPGLMVWSTDQGGQLVVKREGKYDYNEGYILFMYDKLVELGQVLPDKRLALGAAKDSVTVNGEELEITGINSAGQLKDTDVVVKVHVRRKLQNNVG